MTSHRDGAMPVRRNLDFLLRRRTAFLRTFLRQGDRVLEIGAGAGIVRPYVPDIQLVSTDVRPQRWLDAVADAARLPFRDGAFDAVVCLYVLHHLDHPVRGIGEMVRVVRGGGRLLIAEPHLSASLRMALRVTGHEYADSKVDPLRGDRCQTCADRNGNNAVGDRLFEDLERFRGTFPGLRLEHHRLVEWTTFLNSGGVGFRAPFVPLPEWALAWLGRLDDSLMRFERIFPMGRELVFRKGC